MNLPDFNQMAQRYSKELYQSVLPFWLRNPRTWRAAVISPA